MNVLLFSNGKVAGNTSLLEFGIDWVAEQLNVPAQRTCCLYLLR